MLEEFHFLRPAWLIALLPLLGLTWYWIRRTQRGSNWSSAISEELLTVLLEAKQGSSGRWISGILICALIIATVGLAGPTWEQRPQNVEQKNDALVIVLDLSLSMFAEDLRPSRLARARQKIADILRERDEGLTGLVAYAGDAHAVVPLTDDVGTIENLLGALAPDMMPVLGSNPGHGLELAHQLLENAYMQEGRILLLTDGIDQIADVSRHRNTAFPISILGVGTTSGGAIPISPPGPRRDFLRTQEGNQIIALLDESRLAEVAELGFGRYAQLAVGDQDIDYVLSTPLPTEDATIEVEREFDTWFDQGYWVTVVLIPLLLLGFRRGSLVALLIACVPVPTSYAATAGEGPVNKQAANAADATPISGGDGLSKEPPLNDFWRRLWLRDDQRAIRAFTRGQPERAAALFKDQRWRSAAAYRSGDWRSAEEGFAQDRSADGLYNRGNALARLGDYPGALAHYNEALAINPDDADVQFNKTLIERLLEEKQQAEQQPQDQQQQNQQQQQDQQQQAKDNQQQQEQSDQQEMADSQQQPPPNPEAQEEQDLDGERQDEEQEQQMARRDEKDEALEQWLRRVPDDPGGLLRRKFQHETKQRLRNGDYSNRQTDKVW